MSNSTVTLFLIFCFFKLSFLNRDNNVCKSISDYYKDIKNNPNCYHNPDVYLSVPDIIQRHGYPVQTYKVLTKDGYLLTLFRIPHGRKYFNIGPPVFLQHGIAQSSVVYVNIGRKSLAFTLVDNGYDVWLGNFRGCQYSNVHLRLKTEDKSYWNFSFHEHGIYDLPAQLDLVTKETRRKIIYIGYSMGSTAYFVYNSQFPQIAANTLRVSISLAPVAVLNHLAKSINYLITAWSQLKNIFNEDGNGVMYQRTKEFDRIKAKICLPYPLQMRMCLLPAYMFGLLDPTQEDPVSGLLFDCNDYTHLCTSLTSLCHVLLPVITMQDQDSVSKKTIYHFAQLIRFGRFAYYENKRGDLRTLPEYNLHQINVPNFFIRANKDYIATKMNVEQTFEKLPPQAKPYSILLVNYTDFTHGDFVTAKDAQQLVYKPILKFLNINKDKF